MELQVTMATVNKRTFEYLSLLEQEIVIHFTNLNIFFGGNGNKGTSAPAVKQKKDKLALAGKKKKPDEATEEKSFSL